MPGTLVFALNAHAGYACRHSGACCTAGWSIPVEPQLRNLLQTDRLVPDESGACPKYDRSARLCRIHRERGESMLPESCFQFPRRALVDERGTFITLSHFCPTAAALLVDASVPLAIVPSPSAFPSTRQYDGLDARQEWPPLLRPDVLFDFDSYAAWEQFLVGTLGSSATTVDAAMKAVASAAEDLRAWGPDTGTLAEWTAAIVHRPTAREVPALYERYRSAAAYELAARTVPEGLRAPAIPERVDEFDAALVAPAWDRTAAPAILRYAATKAFGSWTAYQGRGVRTQVAELFLALSVLRVECVRACQQRGTPLDRESLIDAVRASDWLLMHLAERGPLMASLIEVETHAALPSRP